VNEVEWFESQHVPCSALFSMATALYVYLSNYHGGLWSDEYSNLCELLQYYTPSPFQSIDPEVAFEDDWDAKEVYDNLVSGDFSSVNILQLTTLGEIID
jgi:hypothetical protein